MSLSCPVDLDVSRLRREVNAMYASVAAAPEGAFHFHRGPRYATQVLGYDGDALPRLPIEVTARFAGVGNPHVIAPLQPFDCFAGTTKERTASRCGVIGVNLSGMRSRR